VEWYNEVGGSMRRNLKERFNDRSLLFIVSVIIGLNMFFFVNGAIGYFFIIGQWIMIPPIIGALFILIMMPYLIKIFTLKNNATLLSDDQKDQLFFFSLGYAYTGVGLFIIGYFFLNHFMVVLM